MFNQPILLKGEVDVLSHHTHSLIQLALREDIGRGDATTNLLIDENVQATAYVYVKEASRVAGLPIIDAVFAQLDHNLHVEHLVPEGQDVAEKTAVTRLKGSARTILTGERTALNFLSRLTGVATRTRDAVAKLVGTRAKLLDTRKTTPGWR